MGDKIGNSAISIKRMELQRHEQLQTIRRLELRLMEMDDEKLKIAESIVNTRTSILEIEKNLAAEGVKF
jgi:hypothetical protein